MNKHWARWIHASLFTYFDTYSKANGITIHFEAQDRNTAGKKDWIEARWDGPRAVELSRKNWRLDIEVNVLVSSVIGRDDTHKHKKQVGLVQAAYIRAIPIYKYGDNTEIDTQELLGCLQLRSDDQEAIVTSYFGKIETDVVLEQSTVEAHYRLSLTTEE